MSSVTLNCRKCVMREEELSYKESRENKRKRKREDEGKC